MPPATTRVPPVPSCLSIKETVLVLQPALSEKVSGWILATKTHLTAAHSEASEGTEDIHYFLDMDMEVLGWPEEGRRQEYKHRDVLE